MEMAQVQDYFDKFSYTAARFVMHAFIVQWAIELMLTLTQLLVVSVGRNFNRYCALVTLIASLVAEYFCPGRIFATYVLCCHVMFSTFILLRLLCYPGDACYSYAILHFITCYYIAKILVKPLHVVGLMFAILTTINALYEFMPREADSDDDDDDDDDDNDSTVVEEDAHDKDNKDAEDKKGDNNGL